MNIIKEQYKEFIKKLQKEIENNHSWSKEWLFGLANFQYKKPYTGINSLLLPSLMAKKGHKKKYFLTFGQIKKLGLSVKKGARSYPLFFYRIVEKEIEDEEKISYPMLKKYNIFNIEDIEGIEDEVPPEIEFAFNFKEIESKIFTVVNREYGNPAYVVGKNTIKMPDVSDFSNEDAYMAALFHELSHWSIEHIKRKSSQYAYEETVAEISAAMLCRKYNVKYPIERHAGYLKSWLKNLKSSEFYFAAKDAISVFEYLSSTLLK